MAMPKMRDVKIHYACLGKGPLLVMIHGFPDYWYTWRQQMEVLSEDYQCVAIDNRGYNLSDKPKGVDHYAMHLLIGDVAAVIKHFGQEKAVIIGHDWGGAISWALAMLRPELLERLIILNVAHPSALRREIINNPSQKRSSQYARDFQEPDAHRQLAKIFQDNNLLMEYQAEGGSLAGMGDAELLSLWVKDPQAEKDTSRPSKNRILRPCLIIINGTIPNRTPRRVKRFDHSLRLRCRS